MFIQINAKKQKMAGVDDIQVCARGWLDYMIETKYFLGETRVEDCLKGLSTVQLEKLGLSNNDVQKVRDR
jgi:hypothetical protein